MTGAKAIQLLLDLLAIVSAGTGLWLAEFAKPRRVVLGMAFVAAGFAATIANFLI